MESVTGGASKELLPLGRKSVLQRIIEEARLADPDEIVVVTARHKADLIEQVENWSQSEFADIPLRLAFQDLPNGVVGAVQAADVEDDLIIMLGDCVFDLSPVPRMASLIHRGIDGCIAVEEVESSQVRLYGIVEVNEATGTIKSIVEKPNPAETQSRWAVAARYALTKSLSAELDKFPVEAEREVGMTELLNVLIAQGADLRAIALQPDQRRFDCGSAEEYALARREVWD